MREVRIGVVIVVAIERQCLLNCKLYGVYVIIIRAHKIISLTQLCYYTGYHS